MIIKLMIKIIIATWSMSAPTAQSTTTEVGIPASINDLIIAPLENHKINIKNSN